MINNYILEQLKKDQVSNLLELENSLREISQKIILCTLSKTNFFNKAVFC